MDYEKSSPSAVVEDQDQYLQSLPRGVRFSPNNEEVIHYLRDKVNNKFDSISQLIGQVDLKNCEPSEFYMQEEKRREDVFVFWQPERTGKRTNRTTKGGYWKMTGRDKEIYEGGTKSNKGDLIGMRKTLVFHNGRAPNGVKTNYAMHEYKLAGKFQLPKYSSKDEWVVCKISYKKIPEIKTTTSNEDAAGANPDNVSLNSTAPTGYSFPSNVYLNNTVPNDCSFPSNVSLNSTAPTNYSFPANVYSKNTVPNDCSFLANVYPNSTTPNNYTFPANVYPSNIAPNDYSFPANVYPSNIDPNDYSFPTNVYSKSTAPNECSFPANVYPNHYYFPANVSQNSAAPNDYSFPVSPDNTAPNHYSLPTNVYPNSAAPIDYSFPANMNE